MKMHRNHSVVNVCTRINTLTLVVSFAELISQAIGALPF